MNSKEERLAWQRLKKLWVLLKKRPSKRLPKNKRPQRLKLRINRRLQVRPLQSSPPARLKEISPILIPGLWRCVPPIRLSSAITARQSLMTFLRSLSQPAFPSIQTIRKKLNLFWTSWRKILAGFLTEWPSQPMPDTLAKPIWCFLKTPCSTRLLPQKGWNMVKSFHRFEGGLQTTWRPRSEWSESSPLNAAKRFTPRESQPLNQSLAR